MFTNNKKLLVIGVSCLSFFALGRFSASQVQTTKVVNTNLEEQKNKSVHTQTTTITTKEPNGEVKTTTTTDIVANTEVNKKEEITSKIEQAPIKQSKLNVSALLAVNTQHALDIPQYGLSVTKQVLGPITAGIWALNNGTIGLSVGMDF